MLDKWRYVTPDMLAALCERHSLQVVNEGLDRYTFRKPETAAS
jgi:hypothetical protein